ncbi:hypothetical protein LOTGIDRAFT_228273 [Lottia gigantea]|uniref:Fanconi Anaemia group E protein C-terminal domain-containing protein n=1 Tax=Lottia gigantea TaxID=225164 RepID=V4AV12_LOTGI|nr:hypothetical protein LOTGIDRAFT_228273 [Lottia gigantea]ESO97666.1 hypothetical protein LOTGIDRAFT_228273 [Lottia gigantea]
MISARRKQNGKLFKKINPEWQGLFNVLCDKGDNLVLAEEWIQTTLGSGYREFQNWTTLIRDLIRLEPMIDDHAIIMKPIFVLLTSDIQRNLLLILHNHRDSINHSDLTEFLSLIKDHVHQDAWTERLYESLVSGIEEGSGKMKHCSSEGNKQLYQDVLQNLSQASHNTTIPWQRKNFEVSELKDKSPEMKQQPQDSPELFGEFDLEVEAKQQVFGAIEVNLNRSSKKLDQNQSNTAKREDNCESIIISSDEEDVNQTDSKKRKRSLTESFEDNTKKLKEHNNDNIKDYEELMTCLTGDIKNELRELKGNWLQGQNMPSFRLFIHSSSDLIKDYLVYMELWIIEDDSLSAICEYFIQNSDCLSYETIVNFLKHSLQYKFSEIKQAPSRTLTNLISRVGEVFPKQTIDILIGIILESEINPIQTDIICKLIKQTFDPSHHQYLLSHHQYLLRHLVSEIKALNENVISIVQAMIDQKVEMSQDITNNLIGCLLDSAQSLANSQKFGKLLLHFINKYGKQWNASELSRIQVILDRHTSFLKKTALLSFKKLLK